MEQTVKDPNGSDRRGYVVVGLAFLGTAAFFLITDPALLTVAMVVIFGGFLIIGMGLLGRPYVSLDRNGVACRLLFRKKYFRWDELAKVGIRNTKMSRVPMEYLFAIVIVFPGKGGWKRDIFCSVVVPNRPEIRKLIAESYGPLDFDDTKNLNDWEKRYFGF